jgi:hypothetical protein
MKILFYLIIFQLSLAQISYFPENHFFLKERLKYNEANGDRVELLIGVKPFSHSYLINQLSKSEYQNSYLNTSNWKVKSQINYVPKSFSHTDSLVPFLHWKNETISFFGNVTFYNGLISQSELGNVFSYQYRFTGQIKENFYFMTLNRQNSFLLDKNIAYLYDNNSPQNSFFNEKVRRDDIGSSDYSESFFLYEMSNNNFLYIAKIPFEIGEGESGKFILNGYQTSPPTVIGLNLNFWKFNFSSMHGQLLATELTSFKSDSVFNDRSNYKDIPDKYFVNHRLEFDATRNLKFHYNETIIYGNRSMDLSYLNPLIFLRSQEHEQNDRDNVLISFGLKYRIPSLHLLTYHDVLLDEWKISEIASYFNGNEHWFGNKQAMLNGISWAYHDFQMWFEHVSIAPFVYSHKYDVNRYTHDGQSLGYNTGPNSRVYFFKMNYLGFKNMLLSMSHKKVEKGNNYNNDETSNWNIGGSVFHGDDSRFKETRTFLEGNLKTYSVTEFTIAYQPSYYYLFSFDYKNNELNKNIYKFSMRMNL